SRQIGTAWAAVVSDDEGRSDNQCKYRNQATESGDSKDSIKQRFSQPLVSNPGFSGTGKGEEIPVWNVPSFQNVLPGPQVPPEVRIVHGASRHDEQSQK